MIVCRTKHKEVKAIPAEVALAKAHKSWSGLPTWFKKKFQVNKILIGGSVVQVECNRMLVDASGRDMIFIDDKDVLCVMKEEEFFDVYEDIWGSKPKK